MAKQGRGLIMLEPQSHGRDGMPFYLCLAHIPRHLERTCPKRLLRRWRTLLEGDRIRVFHSSGNMVGTLRTREIDQPEGGPPIPNPQSPILNRMWYLDDDFGWHHPLIVLLGAEAEMVKGIGLCKGVEYVPPVVIGRLEEPDHTWP